MVTVSEILLTQLRIEPVTKKKCNFTVSTVHSRVFLSLLKNLSQSSFLFNVSVESSRKYFDSTVMCDFRGKCLSVTLPIVRPLLLPHCMTRVFVTCPFSVLTLSPRDCNLLWKSVIKSILRFQIVRMEYIKLISSYG